MVDILLVDDEAGFVKTLAERLELRGFATRVATDGETALDRIADHPPDIVLLDVMMPKMGGLAVLRRIKIDRPEMPVILLTGRGSTADGIDGMRLGALDYLMKPLDINELIRKIDESTGKDTVP